MDDDQVNQLADDQKSVVNLMQKSYDKYKKESYTRRTKTLVQSKIQELEQYLKDFDDRHLQLLQLDTQKKHSYFVKNYFENAKAWANKVFAEYQGRLDELLKQGSGSTNPPDDENEKPKQSTSSSGETHKPKNSSSWHFESEYEEEDKALLALIGSQTIRFHTLKKLIGNIKSELQPKWYYEFTQWTLQDNWSKICVSHEEILRKLPDFQTHMEYFEAYDDIAIEYNDTVFDLRQKSNSINEQTPNRSCTSEDSNFRLPRVNIPYFDGDYKQWTTFHDIYTNVIHDNKKLGKAEKMQFLKNHLRGEAAKIVRHLHISDSTYDLAWEIICNRFSNKRVLFTTQMELLLYQPKLEVKSASGIKQLHDTTKECLHSIANLGVDIANWGPMVVHIIRKKFDSDSRDQYENYFKKPRDLQTLDEVYEFLETRFQSLEANPTNSLSKSVVNRSFMKPKYANINNTYATKVEEVCSMCKSKHSLFVCTKFQSCLPEQRLEHVRKEKLCYNCLKSHAVSKCSSTVRCRQCKRKHNTKLHDALVKEYNKNVQTQNEPSSLSVAENSSVQTMVTTEYNDLNVLLATAVIQIESQNGTKHLIRALVDQGSQASFVSEKVAQLLKLKRSRTNTSVFGMGMADAGKVKGKVQLKLHPHFKSSFVTETSAFVLPKLTGYLPNEDIDTEKEGHLKQIVLADPQYSKAGAIDAVLGGAVYADIILDGLFKGLQKSSPIAQRTEFGWILSGCIKPRNGSKRITSLVSNVQLDEKLQRFWETEEVNEKSCLSEENQQCEEEFHQTHTRNGDGTYTVKMPFKKEKPKLGDSRKMAWARLMQLEQKLARDEKLKQEYSKFMYEYLTLGHMAPAKPLENNNEAYYLPHQPVFKDSSTTKLRVVFDASAKASNGVSLNDVLCTGPKLQQDITNILIRWRMHRVVFTADVEKMYRQIQIDSSQQNYQRILWRFSIKEPVKEYNLKTVTYGTAPAPYLAIKTLHQLAKDERSSFDKAAKILLSDFYVDDLISGADTLNKAKHIQRDLIELLKTGGFKLRKWTSNRPELLQGIPEDMIEANFLKITDNEFIKALGICWKPTMDKFTYKVSVSTEKKLTKRKIASAIATLFDPLGWISPIIVNAKLILQQLWHENKDWDEEVGTTIKEKWAKFEAELPQVENIQIPRWSKFTTGAHLELHGFCDASEKAYAGVVYSRVVSQFGITTTLLISKTKVAKLKEKTTLPRLELNGAVLLSKLIKRTKDALGNQEVPVTAWSDSTITLAWIKGNPERFPCYVSNRISEININVHSANWFHVKSGENPADLGSRGLSPAVLKNNTLWWNGPDWLSQENIIKRAPDIKNESLTLQAEKEAREKPQKIFSTILSANKEDDITLKYSKFGKLIRVIAYCRRFIHNSRAKKLKLNKNIGMLTIRDLKQAEIDVIKCVQFNEFQHEIVQLRKQKSISKSSKLLSLNPFLDKNEVLRVGGRLGKSTLSFERKHPVILPYKSHLTNMVIENSHKTTLHGGQALTLAHTRYKYWIIKGQSAIKQVLKRCMKCFQYTAKPQQQLMGDLPTARFGVTKPFSKTGIDYAGPITLRMSKGRGSKTYKGYFIVFICMVTKSMHLEVVTDLTAQAFIAAFTRFIGRRGRVTHLYSDNATYFTAADKILQLRSKKEIEAYRSGIISELIKFETEWHFIPPAAPHMGGLWESGVKLVKSHLKRILGETTLTFEELTTTLIQIEACLNSRPLCLLNDDPDSIEVLTPGHFLTTDALIAPPQENLSSEGLSLLTKWQLTTKLSQEFWRKWSNEYLSRMQNRPKWSSIKKNLKVNDVVLIMNEQLPSCQWALGRITEVHPGVDGLVRVVTLRLKDGKYCKRPITKLAPLPIIDNEQTPQTTETEPDHTKLKEAPQISQEHVQHSVTSNLVTLQSYTTKRKRDNFSVSKKKSKIQPVNSTWFSAETQERMSAYAKIKPKPKVFAKNVVSLVLLVCLVLPVVTSNYTIKRPGFGIYTENIGDAQIKRGTFRIEVQTSLNKVLDDKANVSNVIAQISKLCKEASKFIHCEDFLRHLQDEEDELANEIQIILSMMNKQIRKRRGILGSLMQMIFGVNDEVYSRIEALNHNQETLLQSATQQTNIMISTLARANETEAVVIRKLNAFTEKLNKGLKIIYEMTSMVGSVKSDQLHIHFLLIYTAANNYIAEVKERNHKLLHVLYKKGSILELLPHKIIQGLIMNATSHLPSTVKIVAEPRPIVEVEFTADEVLMYGLFDITEIQNYTLLHLTAIPALESEDTYTAITLSTPILAINYNDQIYFELTESELRECVQQQKHIFLCNPTVVKKLDVEPNCVIDELYQRHEGSKCPQQSFSVKTILYKKLLMSNTWLFVANKIKSTSLHCNGVRTDVTLNGTGIIKISKGCILQTKESILKAELNDRISVHKTFHTPINVTTLPKINRLVFAHIEPESVLKSSDQLFRQHTQEETHLNERLQHVTTVVSGSLITILCLSLVIAVIIISRCCKQKGIFIANTTPVPVPKPRSTPDDFTFKNIDLPVHGRENVVNNEI